MRPAHGERPLFVPRKVGKDDWRVVCEACGRLERLDVINDIRRDRALDAARRGA